ncbi:glycosyltransferase family 4 protein [Paramagnetospirillum magneticum]|uniref:Glycosyltransferase n=1 Tax=Paramagnetospirillum magneticum (strain ATCC 700264 / AMB-1) TaxID=342108 RepID=Q2W7D1_PARM1|nr:glycosyltransferase family 4 protein [Paramagnetospirillum magneticum]BAE50244.1 Glycosyltransferase [Paramagnetospirillum magneticum AMB-1]
MRILIIHERYRQRGGEDAVFDTESALLEERGCVVERLVADNDHIDETRGGLALAANAVWSTDGRGRVRRKVQEFRPDIVHIHNWFPLFSPAIHGAIRAEGVPVVQTLHNFRLMCLNGLFLRDGQPCEDCLGSPLAWRGVLRRCYRDDTKASAAVAAMNCWHHLAGTWRRNVDLFLVGSDFARRRFVAAGLPAERIALKPNTVCDPGAEAASWRRPRRGAVFLGRLSPEKGIADLIRAWRDMGHRLTIVGDGPLAAALRAEASSEVDFAGWQDPARVSSILSEAALLCLPSRCYEQWPLVVAEAAAHGLPILASDLGALESLVEEDVTGKRVTPGDVDAWRDAARTLLDSPALLAAMGQNARQVYACRYSPQVVTDLLLGHYARLRASPP